MTADEKPKGKPVIIYDTFDPDNPPVLPEEHVEVTEHDREVARLAAARFAPKPKEG